jgi:hypothetical protein
MLGKVLLGMWFICIDFALRIMALGVMGWKRHDMGPAKMHGRDMFGNCRAWTSTLLFVS